MVGIFGNRTCPCHILAILIAALVCDSDQMLNHGQERILRTQSRTADLQDMSAAVQRTEETAVSSHVLSSVPRLSDQNECRSHLGRTRYLPFLSAV